MSRRQFAVLVAVGLLVFQVSSPVMAIGPKMPKVSVGGGSNLAPLAERIRAANEAFTGGTVALLEARGAMLEAVGDKQTAEKIKVKLAAASAIKDPKEKNAVLLQTERETDAASQAALAKMETQAAAADADASGHFIDSLIGVAAAVVLDIKTVSDVKALQQEAPAAVDAVKSAGGMGAAAEAKNIGFVSSAITGDLPNLVTALPKQITGLVGLLDAGSKFATARGVEVPPAVSSARAQGGTFK